MFKHEKWKDKYTFYQLSNETGTCIKVAPERGGIVSEFVINQKPIFYLDESTFFDSDKNVRGGNPVLFPICGPVKDGRYLLGDKIYEMQQHGLARLLPWDVTEVNEEDAKASITLMLESSSTTRESYPFDFKLKFTYEIMADRLNIYQSYENLSKEPMPFYAGFHPYFKIDSKNDISFNIDAGEFHDIIKEENYSYSEKLSVPNDEEFNIVFKGVKGKEVGFIDSVNHREISVEFDNNFSYIVLWALPGRDFLCMEPWMGNNFSLNTGRDVKLLQPGEKKKCFVSYRVKLL